MKKNVLFHQEPLLCRQIGTPFSLGLGFSDYFFINNLKKRPGRKWFTSNEKIGSSVEGYIMEFVGSYYKQRNEVIERRRESV